MAWVTFSQKLPNGSSATQSVSFNTDNISAITAIDGARPNSPRTLIEVISGKDFWVLEEHAVVMQMITAAQES